MAFTIPCATFARLAKVALRPGEKLPERVPDRPYLSSIRIEHVKGITLAIATNGVIMAIENLGETDQPDGAWNIGITPTILAQCVNEAPFHSSLTYENLQVRTTLNFREMSFASQEFVDWRHAIPTTLPKKSKGGLMLDTDYCVRLLQSAPSGQIVFPQNFDPEWIVILRDPHNDNWYGTFLSREIESETPATVPEWLNHARS